MRRGDWRWCAAVIVSLPLCAGAIYASASPASPDVATSGDYVFVDSFESSDCSLPLGCPVPLSGKACVAGQLTDAATTQPLHATFNVGMACGGGAIGGPCDLAVAAHDALQFATNPQASMPLPSGEKVVDGCGRFRIADLTVPGTPYVAIVAADAPGSDGHVASATLHALVANDRIVGLEADVARTDTVAAWSSLGETDFSLGALLLRYTTSGSPTAGVTAIRQGGSTGQVYRYFSDTDAQRLLPDTTSTATGANGAALVANATLGSYSGVGAETNGCHWTSINAASVPGVIFFAELVCSQ